MIGQVNNVYTRHHRNMLLDYSVRAWQLAAHMVDIGEDWLEIQQMQEIAINLQNYAQHGEDCHCFLPWQSCKVCQAISKVIYGEKEYENM